MKKIFVIANVVIIICLKCNTPSDSNLIQIPSYVAIEFDKYDITPTGSYSEYFITLPDSFNDANWSLKENVCSEGGYNLIKYAGKSLRFLKYPSNEYYKNDKLDIWVIIDSQ